MEVLRLLPGRSSLAKRAGFFARGLLHAGGRHRCPCCGWRVRGFLAEGALLTRRNSGYCPRCNAKARHRRLCLYLAEHTRWLDGEPMRLLEIAPWWAVSRRLQRSPELQFVGVDLRPAGPHVSVLGDAAALPFGEASFDAVICTHVLEHVPRDCAAMAEIYRVLRPGGTAIISVPLRLERATVEDPTLSDPAEQERRFGERGHVRWYGADLADRLRKAGFEISMDAGTALPAQKREKFGLRDDEHLFWCVKGSRHER